MKFFLFLALLVPITSWSQCARPVDEKNVVVFIDANTADGEIAEAAKGACQSGRKFVVIPRNYKEHGKILVPWLQAHRAEEAACGDDGRNTETPRCQAASDRTAQLENAYHAFKRQSKFDLKKSIADELKSISDSGATISALTVSGHDGGGHFGGEKGSISRASLAEALRVHPNINKIESIVLAGCFTGVLSEIPQWRNAFPELKSIYGYDGYAPLADRPAGHQYIRSALTNDKSLRASNNVASLNQRLSQMLPSLNNLNAAAHIQLDCNKEAYYASAGGRLFASVESAPQQCQAGRARLNQIAQLMTPYLEGTTEPPADPGQLRGDYESARQLGHCLAPLSIKLDVEQVFSIRFYSAFKKNFGFFYDEDLKEVEAALSDLPVEAKGTLWIPNSENLAKKTRAETLANIHQMYTVARLYLSPAHKKALKWMIETTSRHFQKLANPFEWHNGNSRDIPPGYVKFKDYVVASNPQQQQQSALSLEQIRNGLQQQQGVEQQRQAQPQQQQQPQQRQ